MCEFAKEKEIEKEKKTQNPNQTQTSPVTQIWPVAFLFLPRPAPHLGPASTPARPEAQPCGPVSLHASAQQTTKAQRSAHGPFPHPARQSPAAQPVRVASPPSLPGRTHGSGSSPSPGRAPLFRARRFSSLPVAPLRRARALGPLAGHPELPLLLEASP